MVINMKYNFNRKIVLLIWLVKGIKGQGINLQKVVQKGYNISQYSSKWCINALNISLNI